jgi:hypothetical protein
MSEPSIDTPFGVCSHTKYEGGPTCVHDAYLRGYADAEEFYTNDCFFCGYGGEWSTSACEDCLSNPANSWYDKR